MSRGRKRLSQAREAALKTKAVRLLLDAAKLSGQPISGEHQKKLRHWLDGLLAGLPSPLPVPTDMRARDLIELANSARELCRSLVPKVNLIADFCFEFGPAFQKVRNVPSFSNLTYMAGIRDSSLGPEETDWAIGPTLERFSELCTAIVDNMPRDKGSKTKVRDILVGRPLPNFVATAGEAFALIAPTGLKPRHRRKFIEFCCILYEIRTGKEPSEEIQAIERQVRYAAPIILRMRDLTGRIHREAAKLQGDRRDDHDIRVGLFIMRETAALSHEVRFGPNQGEGEGDDASEEK